VFPPDLLVGQVVEDRQGRLVVRPAADFERLAFLRILRSAPPSPIVEEHDVIIDQFEGLGG
jgi:rod shape-determining protein MreC